MSADHAVISESNSRHYRDAHAQKAFVPDFHASFENYLLAAGRSFARIESVGVIGRVEVVADYGPPTYTHSPYSSDKGGKAEVDVILNYDARETVVRLRKEMGEGAEPRSISDQTVGPDRDVLLPFEQSRTAKDRTWADRIKSRRWAHARSQRADYSSNHRGTSK
jgi:hypothetical protein